jgi:Zn-dependent protease with chaperone function
MLYRQTAKILMLMGGVFSDVTLGIGSLITTTAQVALLYWSRMSEFTADRAGLFACQDIMTAAGASVKLDWIPVSQKDQIDPRDFIRQARDFKDYDYQTVNRYIKGTIEYSPTFGMTHPWAVLRAAELMKWIESDGYMGVVTRKTAFDE